MKWLKNGYNLSVKALIKCRSPSITSFLYTNYMSNLVKLVVPAKD